MDLDNVTTVDIDDEYNTDTDNNATITEWDHKLLYDVDIDLDALISIMGDMTASKPTGVTAKHLSKVWRIYTKTVEKKLDVTTQLLRQLDYPNLSWNYSTSDRMIRYK